ncbi:MAG: protein of unknown function with transrane region [Parcubacteria group bacterium]|nr:protein of unknown function with transrane region [Parcubacteria group bacterium]
MESQDNNSSIERLKRGLYSRDIRARTDRKNRRLKNESYDVESDWSHEGEEILEKKPIFFKEKRGVAFVTKFLIVSILFFLIASGIAFYKFYWGSNTISANNIEISIVGPVSVSGGEKISLDIKVDNKNKTDLKAADLRVEYPEGSRAIDDLETELKRTRDSIGDIPQGESAVKRVEAILFGEEKIKKEIKITVEYRISGSSAIFYKEKIYEIVISDSPVNIEVSGLKEVNANQAVDFSVTVVSNSPSPIRNLLLKAEYPFGFVFADSSEKSLDPDNSLWSIGDLSPGQKKTIKIYGKLQGQDGEDKVLRFTTGIANDKDEKIIATPLVTSIAEVLIKKPFIGIQVALDGSTANEFVSKSGRIIRADVVWKNNLATQIKDAEILIKFKGDVLNESSVSSEFGFYRSADNTIIFDKTKIPAFASIAPGESGNLSFSFGSLNSYSGESSLVTEPSISMDIAASGKRLEGNNVPQEVLYSSKRIVKIATDARLSSRSLHWNGPFQNTGPMPPKVENETTYTVVWTITNTSNRIKDAKVTATLPIYTKWLSQVSPGTENVSFNSAGSEIVWDVGDIEAGAGIDSPPKEVAFQISLFPSVSQIGQSPVILNESSLTGTDIFTSTLVGETRPNLTTTFRTDPDFKYSEDTVVK